jgi:hypothetical protein
MDQPENMRILLAGALDGSGRLSRTYYRPRRRTITGRQNNSCRAPLDVDVSLAKPFP